MPKKRSRTARRHTYGAPSSVLRRITLGGIVLAVLLVVSGLLAYLTRPEPAATTAPAPAGTAAAESASPEATSGRPKAVASPRKTSDPIVFAKAAT